MSAHGRKSPPPASGTARRWAVWSWSDGDGRGGATELLAPWVVLAGVRFVGRDRVGAVAALVMVVVVVAGGAFAVPSAGASSRRPQVLRVRWHLVSDFGPVGLSGSGRFVLALFENGAGHDVLIDDQTGKRSRLNVPHGCGLGPFAMGGGLLLFPCGYAGASLPPMKLYRLSSPRGWRALAWNPQLVQRCDAQDPQDGQNTLCAPTAIGSHWIEVAVTNCEQFGHDCSSGSNMFQNLDSGRLANDPTSVGGTVIPDLNSPTLARKLCSPLRVPSAGYEQGPSPGTVARYGRFAVSSETATGLFHLQKCGSLSISSWRTPPTPRPLPRSVTRASSSGPRAWTRNKPGFSSTRSDYPASSGWPSRFPQRSARHPHCSSGPATCT